MDMYSLEEPGKFVMLGARIYYHYLLRWRPLNTEANTEANAARARVADSLALPIEQQSR